MNQGLTLNQLIDSLIEFRDANPNKGELPVVILNRDDDYQTIVNFSPETITNLTPKPETFEAIQLW